jgi:prolyl-tRNA synthetase
LDPSKEEVMKECESVYQILIDAGHDVILDDRDIRAGNKFAENEILGIPFSIIIGPRNFANSKYEFVSRRTNDKHELNIDEIKQILEKEK